MLKESILLLACFLVLAQGAPAPQNVIGIPNEEALGDQDGFDSAPESPMASDVGNANEFVDSLLNNVKNNPNTQLDPYVLPERQVGFDTKVLWVPVKGEMKLHQGVVTGISTLHRTGDCTLVYDQGLMNVKVRLGMGVINAKTTANININEVGPSVDVKARIGYADIDMALSVDIGKGKTTVTSFKLNTLSGLEIKMENLGPLSWMFNFFSGLITNTFRNIVQFITEQVLANVVKNQIANMKLPM